MRPRLFSVLLLVAALAVISATQPQAATPPAFTLAQAEDLAANEEAEPERMPEDWPATPPPLPESSADKRLRSPQPLMVIEHWERVPPSPPEPNTLARLYTPPLRAELNHKITFGPEFFAATRPADFAGGRVIPLRDGRRVWVARITVKNASLLNILMEPVDLPPGTSLWGYNQGESRIYPSQDTMKAGKPINPLGKELDAHFFHMFYHEGPIVEFQLAFPAGAKPSSGQPWSMTFHSISANDWKAESRNSPPCAVDAMCIKDDRFFGIAAYRTGVGLAQIKFQNGAIRECTASLVRTYGTPQLGYMLTAGHCFEEPEPGIEVKAITVVWDFVRKGCNGKLPKFGKLPTSQGYAGYILPTNDSALFRLVRDLPKRHHFAWSRDSMSYHATPSGTETRIVRMLSFPAASEFATVAGPMSYSESATCFHCGAECKGECFTDPNFRQNDGYSMYYAWPRQGEVEIGSSGGLALTPNGMINGQQAKVCTRDIAACRYPSCLGKRNWQVVGSFQATALAFRSLLFSPS
jgi:hypothetical protein